MSKRRRTLPASPPLRLPDLPSEALSHAATYLAPPSRALFAVAIGHDCGFVQRSDWSVLDFGCIEQSLASRLSDSDIEQVLSCIDAADNLKTLKLTGCVNVTGTCLECLDNSTALEHIDLSLVGAHKSPVITPEPAISQAATLPILDHLIDLDGSSLRLLVLPKKWRGKPDNEMQQFLRRYDEYLAFRRIICSRCEEYVFEERARGDTVIWEYLPGDIELKASYFGSQCNICHTCVQFFCNSCAARRNESLKFCVRCERDVCASCVPREDCPAPDCNDCICTECGGLNECSQCGNQKCDDCFERCGYCKKLCCSGCFVSCQSNRSCERDEDVHLNFCADCARCETCKDRVCPDCRRVKCIKERENACQGCVKLIAPLFRDRVIANEKEIEKLRKDNEDLRWLIEQDPNNDAA